MKYNKDGDFYSGFWDKSGNAVDLPRQDVKFIDALDSSSFNAVEMRGHEAPHTPNCRRADRKDLIAPVGGPSPCCDSEYKWNFKSPAENEKNAARSTSARRVPRHEDHERWHKMADELCRTILDNVYLEKEVEKLKIALAYTTDFSHFEAWHLFDCQGLKQMDEEDFKQQMAAFCGMQKFNLEAARHLYIRFADPDITQTEFSRMVLPQDP